VTNSNDINTTKSLKGLTIALTVLVFLTGLIDTGFGGVLQIQPEIAAMESNVDYIPELKGLISIWGITLLFFGLITLLSARWIWQKKREGTILGIFALLLDWLLFWQKRKKILSKNRRCKDDRIK